MPYRHAWLTHRGSEGAQPRVFIDHRGWVVIFSYDPSLVVEVVEVGTLLGINSHRVLHTERISQGKHIRRLVHRHQFFLALRMLEYHSSQRTVKQMQQGTIKPIRVSSYFLLS
jgi:hypothetical protein